MLYDSLVQPLAWPDSMIQGICVHRNFLAHFDMQYPQSFAPRTSPRLAEPFKHVRLRFFSLFVMRTGTSARNLYNLLYK